MIELGWLGQVEFTWAFFSAVLSIVLIDLVLAGDNAVVIAMAVKNLPGRQRTWGIALGASGAVLIRVICTFLTQAWKTGRLVAGTILMGLGFVLMFVPIHPGTPVLLAGMAVAGSSHPVVRFLRGRWQRWEQKGRRVATR